MIILLFVTLLPEETKTFLRYVPETNSWNSSLGGKEIRFPASVVLSSNSVSIICVPPKSGEMPEAWAPPCATC